MRRGADDGRGWLPSRKPAGARSRPHEESQTLARLSGALIRALMIPLLAAQARAIRRAPSPGGPVPAGGSTDWLSRLLGQKLEQRERLRRDQNRAAGAQLIAASAVAKSAPDATRCR